MEIDDGLLSQSSRPKAPGNPTVVLVDATLAFSPIVLLAATDAQPPNESHGADLALDTATAAAVPNKSMMIGVC